MLFFLIAHEKLSHSLLRLVVLEPSSFVVQIRAGLEVLILMLFHLFKWLGASVGSIIDSDHCVIWIISLSRLANHNCSHYCLL